MDSRPCTVVTESLSAAAVTASRPWKESTGGFAKCFRKLFSQWNVEYGHISKIYADKNIPNGSLTSGMLTVKFTLDGIHSISTVHHQILY